MFYGKYQEISIIESFSSKHIDLFSALKMCLSFTIFLLLTIKRKLKTNDKTRLRY